MNRSQVITIPTFPIAPHWAERYAKPLSELEREVDGLSVKVRRHLKKMGAAWK